METNHQILYNYYKDYNNRIHGGNWFKNVYRRWFPKKNTNMDNNVVYNNNPLFRNNNNTNMDNNIVYNNNPLFRDNNILNPPIPSLIKTNLTLYDINKHKGGLSEVIIPVIDTLYSNGLRKMKNTELNLNFEIVQFQNKILYGAGTYTAVYKIKDLNYSINDPNVSDNIYIMRLTVYTDGYHMYDDEKIKKEYNLFNRLLPKIYYYGTLNISSLVKYNFAITKVYNDFPVINNDIMIPSILTNIDKFMFLYKNIKMLAELNKYNYAHFDYKLMNVGFEINKITNTIDVILIDYDESTLQEILPTNKNFKVNEEGLVYTIHNTSMTYIPPYISDEDSKDPLNFDYLHPIWKFDKFAIYGLYMIIILLDIKFKKNNLSYYSLPIYDILTNKYHFFPNGIINLYKLNNFNYDELHLKSNSYDNIPTYQLLLDLFDIIMLNPTEYLYR